MALSHYITSGKVSDMIEAAPVTHNDDGTLTRAGALIEARKLWGELGTISSTDDHPMLLVWQIGEFEKTVGRGRTWERALSNSTRRKK